MKSIFSKICVLALCIQLYSCGEKKNETSSEDPIAAKITPSKIKVIYDTDANNELDDQHAQAYLLFNKETFDVRGITVNATFNGALYRAITMKL